MTGKPQTIVSQEHTVMANCWAQLETLPHIARERVLVWLHSKTREEIDERHMLASQVGRSDYGSRLMEQAR